MQFGVDQDDEMQCILMKSTDPAKHYGAEGWNSEPLQIAEMVWSTNVLNKVREAQQVGGPVLTQE